MNELKTICLFTFLLFTVSNFNVSTKKYSFDEKQISLSSEETNAQHAKVRLDANDLKAAAGHGYNLNGHGHGHGHFQYARVPHYGAWEFGYRRGNPYHFREQHEKGNGHQFKSKLRWGDKHGGYGEHFWDYNHAPKHGHGNYGSDKH